MTRLLRLLAFAIAVAGVVDPAITLSGAGRARVAVVVPDPAAADSLAIHDRISRDLSSSYDVVQAITSDTSGAVVIGRAYPDERVMRTRFGAALTDALLVTTVTTAAASGNGAHIVRVDAPREVPAATAIHVEAEIESRGIVGQTTDAIATIAGVEVGRASHKWTADGERWRASIDAVPVGDPPYLLRIQAGDQADTVIGLRRDPIRVEFYDPRPSWATTFVRRALEADPRFRIATLSSTSRGIATRTGDAVSLSDPRLDSFDTVVVGGLDHLTSADSRALDRYMRERGGAVVVLPDQRIDSGPARDLLGPADAGHYDPELAERLLEQPAKLATVPPAAALQASELLVIRAAGPAADVLARMPGAEAAPVIVTMPRGDGRLLLSGAMDAWRYRAADNGAFDRFWQSTLAGLALAVPPPIAIDVEPPLPRPGETGTIVARVHSRGVGEVSASIDGEPLRLLPAAEPGVYRGEFVSGGVGRSTIEVRAQLTATTPGPKGPGLREEQGSVSAPGLKGPGLLNQGPGLSKEQSSALATSAKGPGLLDQGPGLLRATRSLIVDADVQRLQPAPTPSLSLLAQSHRGIDVTPDRIPDLERFIRGAVVAPRVPVVRHPMRSTWWMLPFALCLSTEWWLRRRAGKR